jgi:hypothetical protein
MGDDVMFVEPYGKALFLELCSRLYGLKLVTKEETLQDDNRVESVRFFFQKEILEEVNHPSLQNEVAAIQYNGINNNSVFTQVNGVTLRLYVAPLSALGIDDILETFKAYRSELKGPQNSSYYNYVFVDPYTSIEVSQYIDELFTNLDNKIKDRLHSVHASLPITEIPEEIIRIVAEPALA